MPWVVDLWEVSCGKNLCSAVNLKESGIRVRLFHAAVMPQKKRKTSPCRVSNVVSTMGHCVRATVTKSFSLETCQHLITVDF